LTGYLAITFIAQLPDCLMALLVSCPTDRLFDGLLFSVGVSIGSFINTLQN